MREKTAAPAPEIRIGQVWQEVDPRFTHLPLRTVEHIGPIYKHKASRNRVIEVRDVTMRAGASQRISIGRSDRFNGKRGGYVLVKDVQA